MTRYALEEFGNVKVTKERKNYLNPITKRKIAKSIAKMIRGNEVDKKFILMLMK